MPERYVVRGDDDKILSTLAGLNGIEPLETRPGENNNITYLKCRTTSPSDLVQHLLEKPSVRDVYPANLIIVECATEFIPQAPGGSGSDTHDVSDMLRYRKRLERYHEKISPLFNSGIMLDKPTAQDACLRFLAEDNDTLDDVLKIIADSKYVISFHNIDGIRSTSSSFILTDAKRQTIELHYAFATTTPNSSDTYDISELMQ